MAKHGNGIKKVSFNTENAKSFMVLSKDSLEALKDLEKFDVVQYGKAAVDLLQNPGTQFATFLDLPGKLLFYQIKP